MQLANSQDDTPAAPVSDSNADGFLNPEQPACSIGMESSNEAQLESLKEAELASENAALSATLWEMGKRVLALEHRVNSTEVSLP